MDALSSGGLDQTGEDAVGLESAIGSGPEADFAKDHQMPKRLFGVVVGGGYAGTPEEGEEEFLFGSGEIGPEGLGGFETEWLFADGMEFPKEALFEPGRLLPRKIAGFELLACAAEL